MEKPLRVAVCEDTECEEKKLLSVLSKAEIPTECAVFRSGEELVEGYKPNTFDLLLVDIYMGGMTGVDAVAKIRELDASVPVAFVTTSTDHALASYRLAALRYIEKPYGQKDIDDILRLAKMERDNAPGLVVRRNGREEKIRFSEIVYLEQQTHLVNIYLRDGRDGSDGCPSAQVYAKLSDLFPQFEGQPFFSPHKSFLANLACVRYIDAELKCFAMCNGKNVPIRRETMGKAKKALGDFLFGKTRGLSV